VKNFFLLTFALCLVSSSFCQDPVPVDQSGEGGIIWYDALDLGLTGQAWDETAHPYDRLPAKAKGLVRDPVWMLGTNTAGMSVHFSTNSGKIWAKWVERSRWLFTALPFNREAVQAVRVWLHQISFHGC